MIAQVQGTVVGLTPSAVVLATAGGLGLRAETTPATSAALRVGASVTLHTTLVVREDSMTLYGFSEIADRDMFEAVQSASGIGPRIAQAAVAALGPDVIAAAVAAEDTAVLTRIPGVGPKGARRMVLELKDRLAALAAPSPEGVAAVASPAGESWRRQVRDGLEGLGWSTKEAEKACDAVAEEAEAMTSAGEVNVAVLLRSALRGLART